MAAFAGPKSAADSLTVPRKRLLSRKIFWLTRADGCSVEERHSRDHRFHRRKIAVEG